MRPTACKRRRPPRGLTLIEMVVALAVLGVIAMMALPIIELPVRGWTEAGARRELASDLRLARVRLDDDLQRALPGSARHRQVGARHFLEVMLVRATARARDGTHAGALQCPVCGLPGNDDSLQAGCNETCFTTLGPWVGDPLQPGTDWLVVNPRQPGLPGDPYVGGGAIVPAGIKSRILAVTPIAGGTRVDIAPKNFSTLAPSRRVWAVSEAVSYECDPVAGRLLRHRGYAMQAVQPVAFAAANAESVAVGVAVCSVAVTSDAAHPPRQHVALRIELRRPGVVPAASMEALWQWSLREP